jgi:hypothetical protein
MYVSAPAMQSMAGKSCVAMLYQIRHAALRRCGGIRDRALATTDTIAFAATWLLTVATDEISSNGNTKSQAVAAFATWWMTRHIPSG